MLCSRKACSCLLTTSLRTISRTQVVTGKANQDNLHKPQSQVLARIRKNQKGRSLPQICRIERAILYSQMIGIAGEAWPFSGETRTCEILKRENANNIPQPLLGHVIRVSKLSVWGGEEEETRVVDRRCDV